MEITYIKTRDHLVDDLKKESIKIFTYLFKSYPSLQDLKQQSVDPYDFNCKTIVNCSVWNKSSTIGSKFYPVSKHKDFVLGTLEDKTTQVYMTQDLI